MDTLLDFFVNGLGLTKEQRALLMRAAWFTVVSGHILWVCGGLTVVGLASPFARAETTIRLAEEMRADRIERIEHEILTTRQDQCKAIKENNVAAARLYNERIQELQTKLFYLGQREARIPGCNEV
jgi:hypothetical protein